MVPGGPLCGIKSMELRHFPLAQPTKGGGDLSAELIEDGLKGIKEVYRVFSPKSTYDFSFACTGRCV
jgi:hypothetical protein